MLNFLNKAALWVLVFGPVLYFGSSVVGAFQDHNDKMNTVIDGNVAYSFCKMAGVSDVDSCAMKRVQLYRNSPKTYQRDLLDFSK